MGDGGQGFTIKGDQYVEPPPTGGQAFPTHPDSSGKWGLFNGMTLRDFFAGQALVGLPPVWVNSGEVLNSKEIAESCYKVADAMIKERDAKEKS